MKFSLDPEYLSWLLKFTSACNKKNVLRGIEPLSSLGKLSAKNFHNLVTLEHFECHYQQQGLLFLYTSGEGFTDGQHEMKSLRQHHIPTEIYDKSAIRQVEPAVSEEVVGGIHYTGDANINPGLFLGLLRERISSMGAEVYENNPVTGFETRHGRIQRIQTRSGDFTADEILIAAGSWSPEIVRGLSLKIPVQPARGYSLTTKPGKQTIKHALLLGERRVAVSPMGNLLRITGRLELSNLDRSVNPLQIIGIERAAREYIHLDKPLEILETWAGLRPTTPDGMPIIGRAPNFANLTLATGHAMLGLSLGPGTGQLVAELLNGHKTTIDLTPFRIDRF